MLVVLWPMEKRAAHHLKPAVDIGNEKWRPMKLRLKRKSMESVEKDFPAFSFHWKTLEIDGKRSHVCHARSANLLSAADDGGICAAISGTFWNQMAEPRQTSRLIDHDLNSPIRIKHGTEISGKYHIS